MKTYTLQLRRIRYEQVEVTAQNEHEAYLLAQAGGGTAGSLTHDRSELLSITESRGAERRTAYREANGGNV